MDTATAVPIEVNDKEAGPAASAVEQPVQVQPPEADRVPVDATTSPLEALQAEFAEEVVVRRLFKRLPARNERLVAEYKPLPLKDAKRAIQNNSDPTMLVASLLDICVHAPEHPSLAEAAPDDMRAQRGLVPLSVLIGKPELGTLGFDKRLTDILKIKFGSAVEIALTLFEDNDLALATQAGELGEWSVKTKREDIQDFALGS